MSALAKRFAEAGARQARESLLEVEAVPTRFIQLDWATRVDGWPIRRAAVIHGPSNGGKSLAAIGLAGSFVEAGHYADFVDAERTTTPKWLGELLGETASRPEFTARKPDTYEQCVDQTRELHRAIADAKASGDVPPTTSLITIVDSLRKLIPEDIVKKISKFGAEGEKGSIDGMNGRAAQMRAALNAAWLDELVPLLDNCGTAWVAIARETEDPDADPWAKKFGNDYKIGGGKAVIYDSSLRLRIERAGWVTIEKDGKQLVVGERHRITIAKTKVGGKDGRASIAFFHSSNGILMPEGFDRARDVVELGLRLGVLEMRGHRVAWRPAQAAGDVTWPSREKAIAELNTPGVEELKMLEADVRAKFAGSEREEEEQET